MPFAFPARRVCLGALTLLACHALLSSALPDEVLTVRVASGREFAGRMLPRSDAVRMWLRLGEAGGAGVSIDRPIAWDQIVAVRSGARTVPLDELRGQPSSSDIVLPLPAKKNPDPPVLFAPLRAVDVATEVWLDNWDHDQEIDGLSLLVTPLTQGGQMYPATLTVEAEVFAPRHYSFSMRPTTAGGAVERIARCSTVVRAEQYGSRGALVRLPFRWPGPEFDSTISRYALVKLRIGVPGSGVFERTYDGVRIRPWSPTRDLLEQWTGSRYLPSEQRPYLP